MRHHPTHRAPILRDGPAALPPISKGAWSGSSFTALQGEYASKLNDALSKQGFRRSQNVLYRPSCAECSACLSARIRVADFNPRSPSAGS